MKPNTVGTFYVATDLLHKDPEALANLFARLRVLPVRVEALFDPQVVEYRAWSPYFAEIPEGEVWPHYEVVMQAGPDGALLHAEFKRATGMAGVRKGALDAD